MTNFEFVFSLFGLLLGLALAEVLGGFGRAIQMRRKVRVGWLTPLLGLIVAFDLTSFWGTAWMVRDHIPAAAASMLYGLLVTGLYYLVARLVFPDDPAEWPDYDAYFFAHKKAVLGGVVLCNLLGMAGQAATGGYNPFATTFSSATTVVFFGMLLLAMWIPGRRPNIAILAFFAAMYVVIALLTLESQAAGG